MASFIVPSLVPSCLKYAAPSVQLSIRQTSEKAGRRSGHEKLQSARTSFSACNVDVTAKKFFGQVSRQRVWLSPVHYQCPQERFSINVRADATQQKPEIKWVTANVVATEEVAEDHCGLTLRITIPRGYTDSFLYTTPGQYVQIRIGDGKPGFFAIASPPFSMTKVESKGTGESEQKSFNHEFLIKRADGIAETLCELKPGDSVEVSQVMGKGFNLLKFQHVFQYKTILLFATGSGISAIRSIIEADGIGDLALSFRPDVRLYYGARTPARMSYKDKFPEWKKRGIKVIPVISKPDGTGWEGATGYVQDVFAKDGLNADPSEVGVLVCGLKGMVEGVTGLLVEAGVPKDVILMNF